MPEDGSTKAGLSATTADFRWNPEFQARLSSIIDSVGTLVEAGAVAGVSDEQLGRWRDGKARPTFFGLANLAAAAGKSLDWLLNGDTSLAVAAQPGPGLVTAPTAEFAFLPRYNVVASAGHGRLAEDEGVIERLAFRLDWLRDMGIDAKNAGLLTASGDSMLPTIPDGALMLVVRGENIAVRSGYIYVIVLNGEVLVKRVSRNVDGSLDLISDNKLYPVQKVQQVDFDRLFIAGRVFWIGFKL